MNAVLLLFVIYIYITPLGFKKPCSSWLEVAWLGLVYYISDISEKAQQLWCLTEEALSPSSSTKDDNNLESISIKY